MPQTTTVAGTQGSVLNQYRRHRAAPGIQLGLDHMAAGQFVRIGFEFQDLGLQQNHLQQFVDPGFCLAETMTKIASPPQASGTSPCSLSSR
jgi:hypothetical protein